MTRAKGRRHFVSGLEMGDWTRTPRFLEGVRVIVLGEGAACLCANTLEALGAEVSRAAASKMKGLSAADVIVAAGLPERLGLPPWESLRADHPHLIVASITPFGLSGPRRNWLSCNLLAAASGGQLHVTGLPDRTPLPLFGHQALSLGSLNAAVGVTLALLRRDASGQGALVDVSLQEAVASGLDHVLVRHFATGTVPGRRGSRQWNDSSVVVRCSDRPLVLFPFLQWDTMVEWMATEGMAGDLADPEFRDPEVRSTRFDEILETISRWTATHTSAELFETAQLMSLPWAPVLAPAEAEACPQFKARGYAPRGGALPCRFSLDEGPKSTVPLPSVPSALPLDGIRVLDLTRVLAGPFATRLLADFGADVIKVQTHRTAGGAEADDQPYFAMWNRNKRSVTIDLDRAEGRAALCELARRCDVVVENFSPRVLDNWGLGYRSFWEVNPGIVLLRMSAAGQTGPWRDLVAYGPTIHALSGLTHLTTYPGSPPIGPGFAYSDVVAGLYGALSVSASLFERNRGGRGRYIDLSEHEALAGLVAQPGDKTPESTRAAPYGCLRCRGEDQWCAVAVFEEAQWHGLCGVLNLKELSDDARFRDLWARRRNSEEMVSLLEARTGERDAQELAAELQRRGVPAAAVQDARQLGADPHLAYRGFFATLDHPRFGELKTDRGAVWLDHCHTPLRPAPLLGQDNEAVFSGLLGWPREKVVRLQADGVLY